MLDYDREASRYDDTRGGVPRAIAAAAAVDRLLPAGTSVVLDLAGGTGIVSEQLAGPSRALVVLDRSHGMLRRAVERLPGRGVQADAARLPLADGCVDAVAMVWLLHLVDHPEQVLAEAVRVLTPGGTLVTTVDKRAAHGHPVDEHAGDSRPRVEATLRALGAEPAGSTTFAGVGQQGEPVYSLVAFRCGEGR
ncbi:MAG: methyltransferase domain-containing protein [Propionibacteriales bacterium]|nr:methyltransferase domain-containing protein [Propionibacteriales bacterium]